MAEVTLQKFMERTFSKDTLEKIEEILDHHRDERKYGHYRDERKYLFRSNEHYSKYQIGIKPSNYDIGKVEDLRIRCIQHANKHWEKYAALLKEFRKAEFASFLDMDSYRVYICDDTKLYGFPSSERGNISFQWGYFRKWTDEDGGHKVTIDYEHNPELARRYYRFEQANRSMWYRVGVCNVTLESLLENFIRAQHKPPYEPYFNRTVKLTINGREYFYSINMGLNENIITVGKVHWPGESTVEEYDF